PRPGRGWSGSATNPSCSRPSSNTQDYRYRRPSVDFTRPVSLDGLRVPSQGTRFVQVRVINLRDADSQERDAPSLGNDLVRFLKARGFKPDSIGLRQLLRLILSTSVVRLSNFRSPPNYYPEERFDQIPTHFDQLNGWELPAALWRLKDSPERTDRERFRRVQSVFKEVSEGIEVDVVLESEEVTPLAPPTNPATEHPSPVPNIPTNAPAPAYRQFPRIRFFDKPYEFGSPYASAGLYESLLLVFTAFESEGAVVVLDEPATNLHPAKQRAFARLLTTRLSASGVQLFVITHAPSFVDRQNLRGLIRVDRKQGATRLLPIDRKAGFAYDELASQAQILPNLIPMLFAKKVILFEGEQEARSLPVWFRKIEPGIEPADLGIDTGDGGGDPKVEMHARALKKLGIPFAIVGDLKGKKGVRSLTPHVFTVKYTDFGGMVKKECPAELQRVYSRKPWPKKIGADACRRVAEDAAPPPSVVALWQRIKKFIEDPV
ncbi:MAG: AAA family ATPase, partial [Nitrososphaerales archaeon]